MKRLHIIQHAAFESPGVIEEFAIEHGFTITRSHPYLGDQLPDTDTFDWLVIMGGPMNVDQQSEYPWLAAEKIFIKKAIDSNKKILGVCLGAQLIASSLGARVNPNQYKEIGWYPIQCIAHNVSGSHLLSGIPESPIVFHWHGDTFAIPEGATPIASTLACRNQGFIIRNNVVALQFHMEVTPLIVNEMLEQCGAEITEQPYIQDIKTIKEGCALYAAQANRHMKCLLNNLLNSELST